MKWVVMPDGSFIRSHIAFLLCLRPQQRLDRAALISRRGPPPLVKVAAPRLCPGIREA
jgi:hypothetical protein